MVDVLVNNYGVAEGGGWFTAGPDDWIDAYEKNVLSGVRLVQRLVPGMRDRGFGRVIFVSTVGTARPATRTPHYYASKAAIPNLALGLAKELAGSGITVNVVSPGLIATREVRERFERLRPFLTAEGGGARYSQVAEKLGMSESAVKVAVHRSRRRFGELLREEVAGTVDEPGAVDGEIRYLFSAIGS